MSNVQRVWFFESLTITTNHSHQLTIFSKNLVQNLAGLILTLFRLYYIKLITGFMRNFKCHLTINFNLQISGEKHEF